MKFVWTEPDEDHGNDIVSELKIGFYRFLAIQYLDRNLIARGLPELYLYGPDIQDDGICLGKFESIFEAEEYTQQTINNALALWIRLSPKKDN